MDNTTRSVWLASAAMPRFGSVTGDLTADVVVIGGGLVGLSTALLLADDGAEVVVVEARGVGGRTSGHTTGKVTSQHGAIYTELVKKHDRETAARYGAANEAAMVQIASLVETLAIDCELTRSPSYVYSTDPGQRTSLEREAATAADLGLPAALVGPENVGIPGVVAAVRFTDQLHLHPAKYVAGLAAAFVERGGRIFDQTRVVDVTAKGDTVVATTESGATVAAGHAVMATLSPIGVTGGFFARVRPRRSSGIAVRLPAPAPAGMAITVDDPVRSTRPWPGGGPNGLIVVGSGPVTTSPGDADHVAQADTAANEQALLDWVRSTWDTGAITAEHFWSAHDYAHPICSHTSGRCPATTASWSRQG